WGAGRDVWVRGHSGCWARRVGCVAIFWLVGPGESVLSVGWAIRCHIRIGNGDPDRKRRSG
ncbi:hypothetical protein, partial [Corynebacterium durum]|uniref:hypothetical protein n=1 Tax=Corynebacterium durum TaxID=61592 RepID=UPI0028E228D6